MLVHLPSTIILFVDDNNNVSLLLYSRMYLTLVIVIVCHSISFVFLTISLVVTVVTAVFVRLMATKKNDQNTLIVGMRHMPMYVSLITTAGSSSTIISCCYVSCNKVMKISKNIMLLLKNDETVADDATTELLLSKSLKVGRRALNERALSSRRRDVCTICTSRYSRDSDTRGCECRGIGTVVTSCSLQLVGS